jgi:anti-anti-sigma factor
MEPTGRPPTNCPLSISAVVAERRTLIELAGEVDVETVPMLQASLALATAQSRGEVIVDLAEVTFMSAVGLFELVKTAEALRDGGWRIEFQRPSPPVAKLLEWTGPVPTRQDTGGLLREPRQGSGARRVEP